MKNVFETMKLKLRHIQNRGNSFTKQQSYNNGEMKDIVNGKFSLRKVEVSRKQSQSLVYVIKNWRIRE